jgi:hypothetical protein
MTDPPLAGRRSLDTHKEPDQVLSPVQLCNVLYGTAPSKIRPDNTIPSQTSAPPEFGRLLSSMPRTL